MEKNNEIVIIGAYSPTNNRVIGAKLVDESGLHYTYLRMTWLYNQEGNRSYKLIPQGEPYKGDQVTRQAVAQYIMDLLQDLSRDLAGSASGLTNAMHQIGGPIGLSVIMAATSNFYVSLGWMAGFSLVDLLFVLIFVYQFGKNP